MCVMGWSIAQLGIRLHNGLTVGLRTFMQTLHGDLAKVETTPSIRSSPLFTTNRKYLCTQNPHGTTALFYLDMQSCLVVHNSLWWNDGNVAWRDNVIIHSSSDGGRLSFFKCDCSFFTANTRLHQLHWGDRKMGTAIHICPTCLSEGSQNAGSIRPSVSLTALFIHYVAIIYQAI